jgi:hypothetical protein
LRVAIATSARAGFFRPRQADTQFIDDAPRPRRHHQHAIGKEHRLGDAVRDEQHRLALREPD